MSQKACAVKRRGESAAQPIRIARDDDIRVVPEDETRSR
jgi:hypothetical protein